MTIGECMDALEHEWSMGIDPCVPTSSKEQKATENQTMSTVTTTTPMKTDQKEGSTATASKKEEWKASPNRRHQYAGIALDNVCHDHDHIGGQFARPRRFEVAAALNRLRSASFR
jgi:hypothetical protein